MTTPAHELADQFEPQFREAFLAMVAQLADLADPKVLEGLIDRGDITGIINYWVSIIGQNLSTHLQSFGKLYGDLAEGVGFVAIEGVFDASSPRMLQFINSRAGRLVKGVSEDTVTAIRTILFSGISSGIGSRATGRLLRSVVGLLPAHSRAVSSYSVGLAENNYSPEYVAHQTEVYANRLLMYRTDMIARTETMTAASAGQQEAWDQMIETGILQNHRTWKEWMVTDDDRLCPFCAPLDGQRVRVGSMFRSTHKGFPDGEPEGFSPGRERMRKEPIKPDPRLPTRDLLGRFVSISKANELTPLRSPKSVQHPPLHPSCRCAVVLRFDD